MHKKNFTNLCVKNWKSRKPCDKNTIHPRRYTDSTEGSTYTKSLTRKSGKRTQQTNRPKTYYKVGNCSDKQFISPILITVKKGPNSQTCIRFKEK